MDAYEPLQAYFGDIHNHCAIGYGHGSIEDAFRNARMQLDFVCVTCHGHWGDLPLDETRLKSVVDYHQRGFDVTAEQWHHVQAVVEANYQPGKFTTFLGYEWHSLEYGDHCIYFNGSQGDIIRVKSLDDLRARLREFRASGLDCLLLPHHIGYKQGYRGINWATYTEELSPIVEIMSMHGASESPEAAYPYLHTMGPRHWHSTYQYGLSQGHIVGVMGSTDHHSAHPGSYGHGRLGVWAQDCTRDAIWDAIKRRRTVALTGDNIALQFTVNDAPIGSILPFNRNRDIQVTVEGGSGIDYVEVVWNNQVIQRANGFEQALRFLYPYDHRLKIYFEVGWAEKGENVDWDVAISIENGDLLHVEPRFRGHEIVAPQSEEAETYAFSSWEQVGSESVHFKTRTWGNATTTTASTQGICLTLYGTPQTRINAVINGENTTVTLPDLLNGPQSGYLGGFLTPAYCFHRATSLNDYRLNTTLSHQSEGGQRDWYYVRVRQHNGQWAWSSPIWIEGTP